MIQELIIARKARISESVIVILIIAMILIIAVPIYAKAVTAAEKTSHDANVYCIESAINLYMATHDNANRVNVQTRDIKSYLHDWPTYPHQYKVVNGQVCYFD